MAAVVGAEAGPESRAGLEGAVVDGHEGDVSVFVSFADFECADGGGSVFDLHCRVSCGRLGFVGQAVLAPVCLFVARGGLLLNTMDLTAWW